MKRLRRLRKTISLGRQENFLPMELHVSSESQQYQKDLLDTAFSLCLWIGFLGPGTCECGCAGVVFTLITSEPSAPDPAPASAAPFSPLPRRGVAARRPLPLSTSSVSA